MKITISEDQPPLVIQDSSELDAVITTLAEETRALGILNILIMVADNGNIFYLVVGSDETVLGLDYAHRKPPYYSSRGTAQSDYPVMTAYLALSHHTEFSRRSVIPMEDGLNALHQFFETGQRPTTVQWEEV
jgi:hypothetical protein